MNRKLIAFFAAVLALGSADLFAQNFFGPAVIGPTTPGDCLEAATPPQPSNGIVDAGAPCGSGGGGAVDKVSAGASGLLTSSPTTGNVVVDVAPIATKTVLANTTGSTAVPSADTITALLDAQLGATTGGVALRGASVWGSLADVATGSVLVSGGSGAVPTWSTSLPFAVPLSGLATQAAHTVVGNPTASSAAPTTLTLGGFLTDSGSALNVVTGTSGASIPLLSTANTWMLAQTFSTLPVWPSQGANLFYASPNGSSGAPSFRALAGADLPNPTTSSLGGVQAVASIAHEWVNTISAFGVPGLSQPACGDLSNAAASCSTDATNASNIASGTLPAARLPNPSATTLGGVESIVVKAHQWVNTISTAGVPATTQPAFTDISGSLALAQLPSEAANTVLGALTATTPSALAVPSCSGASNALIWTTGTGFGCNTISGGGSVSITAADGSIVVSPSPITGTGTVTAGLIPVSKGGTNATSAGATAANNIGALAEASNLSDLASAATALTNLGAAPTTNPMFGGVASFNGTTTPTPAAGVLTVTGLATAPVLGASGEGFLQISSTNGLIFSGDGSNNDISFKNSSATNVFTIPHGSTTVSFVALPSIPLASTNVLVGNGSGVAAPVAVSGDGTLANTGALSVTKTGGIAFAPSATTDTTNASNITSGTLASARGGVASNFQSFSSGGTWTKPANITFLNVCGAGGGGGGGGGSAVVAASGGAGGGAGWYSCITIPASAAGSTVTVTIGTGGTGGAPGTSTGVAGNPGGETSFGTILTWFGGGGGSPGTATTATGGAPGGPFSAGSGSTNGLGGGTYVGCGSGTSSSSAGPGFGALGTSLGEGAAAREAGCKAAGGGSGSGGVVGTNGGAGGQAMAGLGGAAGADSLTAPGNGQPGASGLSTCQPGSGGGGGGGTTGAVPAGNGGVGGAMGGAGGGAGSALATGTGGTGGTGGAGGLCVYAW
jgi:hypothetical protein